jgi:hypothetical protein
MDQTWFNVSIMALGGMAGWWMQVMWTSLKDLEKADRMLTDRVAAIDLLVAGEYVKRDQFDNAVSAMFSKLDRIEDKLDRKADKHSQ